MTQISLKAELKSDSPELKITFFVFITYFITISCQQYRWTNKWMDPGQIWNNFPTGSGGDKHRQCSIHYTLCTWILCASAKQLSDWSVSCPSSTFFLLFSPLLCNLFIFCIVINSQMLNKVCSVATIPHSPTTQITFSAVAGLTEKKNPHMAALAVCHHQHVCK